MRGNGIQAFVMHPWLHLHHAGMALPKAARLHSRIMQVFAIMPSK